MLRVFYLGVSFMAKHVAVRKLSAEALTECAADKQ